MPYKAIIAILLAALLGMSGIAQEPDKVKRSRH